MVVSIRKEQFRKIDIKDCPFCYNKIHLRSIKCTHCNEILVKEEDVEGYQKRIDEEIKSVKSNTMSDMFLFFSILSKHLKPHLNIRKGFLKVVSKLNQLD